MAATIRRIAINTGGGDAPGLNAVIHGAVYAARLEGWDLVGIRDGYEGPWCGKSLMWAAQSSGARIEAIHFITSSNNLMEPGQRWTSPKTCSHTSETNRSMP